MIQYSKSLNHPPKSQLLSTRWQTFHRTPCWRREVGSGFNGKSWLWTCVSGLCVRAYVYKPYVFIFLVIILLGMSSITPLPHFASPASPNTRHSSSEWTNRNGEEEDKAVKVTVWWDIENCPIPTGVDPFQVANRITSALRFNGINGPITITAYGNMLQFNPSTCDALFTTGVALKYVPSCLFLIHFIPFLFFFILVLFFLMMMMVVYDRWEEQRWQVDSGWSGLLGCSKPPSCSLLLDIRG